MRCPSLSIHSGWTSSWGTWSSVAFIALLPKSDVMHESPSSSWRCLKSLQVNMYTVSSHCFFGREAVDSMITTITRVLTCCLLKSVKKIHGNKFQEEILESFYRRPRHVRLFTPLQNSAHKPRHVQYILVSLSTQPHSKEEWDEEAGELLQKNTVGDAQVQRFDSRTELNSLHWWRQSRWCRRHCYVIMSWCHENCCVCAAVDREYLTN